MASACRWAAAARLATWRHSRAAPSVPARPVPGQGAGGAATGFTEMPDQAETLADPSPVAMAQAVRRALSRAA